MRRLAAIVAVGVAADRSRDSRQISCAVLRRMVRAARRADQQANLAADRELRLYGTTGHPLTGGWGGTHAAYVAAVRAGCGHVRARRWAHRIGERHVSIPGMLPGGPLTRPAGAGHPPP